MNTWSDSHAARPMMTRWVTILLVANVAVFMLYGLADHLIGGLFADYFALSVAGIMRGRIWQIVTYMFLHAGPGHLLVNMLTLFFIGPELERTMGPRRFLLIYFLSGILGGLAWLALTYPQGAFCVGASGSIFGLLGAFAALFPHRTITLLVFFILPVSLRAWILVGGLALVQLLYLVGPGGGNVAYAAHLAGVVVGYVYTMTVYRPGEAAAWLRSRFRRTPKLTVMTSDTVSRQEIDRILDKIAREGMQALSSSERTILEKASRRGGR